ncbi:MAG: sigma-54-dependent Fis family transcriptional regulator [Gemmatimonadetes bacterium]|nr:sigma-54-dependent Fis family transcriptional regulator [Gemmatimonadota bacterium]
MKPRVLVADDEPTMLELFEETLGDTFDVRVAIDGTEAADLLEREPFELVFLDLRMPGRDGAELVRALRSAGKSLPAVVMSAHAGSERRREILGGGADRFLPKPFLPADIEALARELLAEDPSPSGGLVAEDPATREVLDTIARIAPTRATVLVQGETGTGKEVLAREIHERSGRAGGPFVRVNCAALTESLLESELFGHERGSFTGAVRTTRGLFEAAHRGTLLLDEIGEISAVMQAKLLRVLQEREVRRVGGAENIAVDVRVVATTNRDLAVEVAAGRFREDLYHRLDVLRLDVPPLRSRPGDIEPLTQSILRRKAREHELPTPRITPEAIAALRAHPWPGNVRELENALERALLLASDGMVTAGDLRLDSDRTAGRATGFVPGTKLKDAERQLIVATLLATGGNRTRAAELLGVSVRTMRNKIREYRASGHWGEDE